MFSTSFYILFRSVKHLNIASMSTKPPISPLKLAKKKLRAEIDAKLGKLSANEIACQSKQVHEQLFTLTEFRNAHRVGLYLSLPCEVDTVGILEHCFAQGKQCFMPKYIPKNPVMQFVELRSMADFDSLPFEPKWKIKQPDPHDETRTNALETGGLDVLLVPGVAFTKEGLRLGHGMGYFDRWQAHSAATPNVQHPVTIALALREQIIEDVPVSEYDVRIHKVIWPN